MNKGLDELGEKIARDKMFEEIRNIPVTQDLSGEPLKGDVITVIDKRINLQFEAKVESYERGNLTLTSIDED